MRSDRYKQPEELSGRKEKQEHADFWSGAPAGETGETVPQTTGSGAGGFIRSLVADIIIAAVLAAVVLYFIRPTIVKQSSMEDTLHENDYMIMYRQAYRKSTPERGDIIIFQSELVDEDSGKDKLLIKRVIGLPGDEIKISDGQLYINGDAYEEDYLKDGYTPAFDIPQEGETYTVPEGSYFCMGDNRVGSVDSRRSEVGCVAGVLIRGKVVLRLYPFNEIRSF